MNDDIRMRVASRLFIDVFKQGLLLNVTLGYWEGKMQQDENDVNAQGSNTDREIFVPGFKWLVPKDSTRTFLRFRSRLQLTLEKQSFKVPGMRGSRFVPREAYNHIKEFLELEKKGFLVQVEQFLQQYPTLKESQIRIFNDRYPQFAGQMDQHYPSIEKLEQKFCYDWTPYSWSYTDIYDIANEAKHKLLERSGELVAQSCYEIREYILEATQAVTETIRKSTGKVNLRSVQAFKDRLEQLKRLNIFADPEIASIIDGSMNAMSSISKWEKDEVCGSGLDIHLERVVVDLKESLRELDQDPENLFVFRRAIQLDEQETAQQSEEVGVSRLLRPARSVGLPSNGT